MPAADGLTRGMPATNRQRLPVAFGNPGDRGGVYRTMFSLFITRYRVTRDTPS